MTDSNGLYYMRARYYSPELKRFINADTIKGTINDSRTLNGYAYANGNPISLVDPFGTSAEPGMLKGRKLNYRALSNTSSQTQPIDTNSTDSIWDKIIHFIESIFGGGEEENTSDDISAGSNNGGQPSQTPEPTTESTIAKDGMQAVENYAVGMGVDSALSLLEGPWGDIYSAIGAFLKIYECGKAFDEIDIARAALCANTINIGYHKEHLDTSLVLLPVAGSPPDARMQDQMYGAYKNMYTNCSLWGSDYSIDWSDIEGKTYDQLSYDAKRFVYDKYPDADGGQLWDNALTLRIGSSLVF